MRLVIDLNSILSSCLLVGKDPDSYNIDNEAIPTADYGFDNFLTQYRKTLDMFETTPHQVVGVFDAKGSRKRRQKYYPQYKTHRKQKPQAYYDEFNTLMEGAKRFIRHLGGIIVSDGKSEADDVIAHISPKLDEAVVWTKDKDLLAIPGVTLYLNGEVYPPDTTGEHFAGVERNYIHIYRAIVSDPGDFGPGMGAKGFGFMAFVNFLSVFGGDSLSVLGDLIAERRLDELRENVDEFPKLKNIIDSADKIYLTYELCKWMPIKDHELNWEAGYVRDVIEDEEYSEWYGIKYLVTNNNYDDMLSMVKLHINEAPFIGLDIETDVPQESEDWIKNIQTEIRKDAAQVDVVSSSLCGLSITCGDNLQHTYYFSVNHEDTDNISVENVKDLILSIKDKDIIGHNSTGFELPVLYNNWGEWLPDIMDNLIAASYVDETQFMGLKFLSKKWLRYNQTSYAEVTKSRGMSEISAEEILGYGCDDTIMTCALFNLFKTIMQVEKTYEVFKEVEKDSAYLTAQAFVNGVTIDTKKLGKLAEEDLKLFNDNYDIVEEYLIENKWEGSEFSPLLGLSAAELKRAYYIINGEVLKSKFRKVEKLVEFFNEEEKKYILNGDLISFNKYLLDKFEPDVNFKVNSSKQMGILLYDFMGLPVRYRNKLTDGQRAAGQEKGSPSTDEDALKWAMKEDANEDEKKVLKAILKCKEAVTRNGLYYHPYPCYIHWDTNRIHPSLRQSSTTSRRFAPKAPNVNQLPKRKEAGKKVRGLVKPHHEEAVIVAPDFSGQELRLGAHASQDENFISCYVGNELKDVHSLTGFAICELRNGKYEKYSEFHKAVDNEEKDAKKFRNSGKTTNFLSQYGGGAFTLSKKQLVTEKEAEEFLKAKDLAFPQLKKWKEEYTTKCLKNKYSETMLGARRHIFRELKKGINEDHVLRSALNFHIQSSAAEMTKLVMGRVWRSGILNKYDAEFLFPVHDELVFSVAKKDLEPFCYELKGLMTAPYADMKIPVESSLSIGPNFCDLEDMEWPERKEKYWDI